MIPKTNAKFKLSPEQLKAVEHPGGPLLITAGAGSGKTHTLTSRLAHLLKSGIKPENIIAITFTNKAAKEMRSRISGMFNIKSNMSLVAFNNLPFVGTFHSLGARILKEEAEHAGRTKNFTIFDDNDSLDIIKNILKKLNLPRDRFNPFKVSKKISWIKNEVLEAYELKDKDLISVFREYEKTLAKNDALDFDDLIEKVIKIFEAHPQILEKYRERWQYVLVDEYQDVNTSQYLFIKFLAQKHQNIFVIGDDAQSIYSFRGSDFRNFLNFENDWSKTTIIKLEENYRSTQNILTAASALIKNNKVQKPKNLWTKNPTGSLIQIAAFPNQNDEAQGIAEKILELIRSGETAKEIAVLYRTNAQSRAIEQALIQNQIAYEIFGAVHFYARKEIKDIVAGLRYALNPQDSLSGDRLIKTFNKSLAKNLLKELPRLAQELSLTELINFFLENTDYMEYLEKKFKNPEERRENIKELINFASTFSAKGGSASGGKNPREFLEQIALMSPLDGRPKFKENTVKLMTVHLAKGLEFNNIFIAGATEGILPHERSLARTEDLEEERRLMYVAMTRAKQNLFLGFYGLPSRFLGELPPELIEFKQVKTYGTEYKDWDDETIYIE